MLRAGRPGAAIATDERLTALVVAALLMWLAFHDGGYFPVTWNLSALVLLWLVVLVIVLRRQVALGGLDVALMLGLTGLLAWTWLSALWSISPAMSILEGQRTLLYLAGGAAILLVAPRTGTRAVVAAVFAVSAVVCTAALYDRLVLVNPLPYNRLGGPVGYWNALGMIAAGGICLGLAVTAHERRAEARAAAAFVLPILVGALYLTFSRGSLLALLVGLVVTVAIDPRRRDLVGAGVILALPLTIVAVAMASAHSLTAPAAPAGDVTTDAHRLAGVVLLMSATSAVLSVFIPRLSARLPSLAIPRRFLIGAAAALLLVLIAYAGPAHLSRELVNAFDAPPPNTTSNLDTHLLSLSGSGRTAMWHVALTTFAEHPLLGNGAGTFGRLWLMHRPSPITVQDAHSLYLETLTELGIVGLALLLAVLFVPLVAAKRVLTDSNAHHRPRGGAPYIPVLAAVYLAFILHAAIDWDWEMPIVTMSELACGVAIVAAARREVRPSRRSVRAGGLGIALALGALALVFFVGNSDLNAAGAAAAGGDRNLAVLAERAERWVPWSPDPPHWLATLDLDRGDRTGARHLLANAIARDGTDWTLWLEMAAASNGRARARAFRTATRLDPGDPELLLTAVQDGLFPHHRPLE